MRQITITSRNMATERKPEINKNLNSAMVADYCDSTNIVQCSRQRQVSLYPRTEIENRVVAGQRRCHRYDIRVRLVVLFGTTTFVQKNESWLSSLFLITFVSCVAFFVTFREENVMEVQRYIWLPKNIIFTHEPSSISSFA